VVLDDRLAAHIPQEVFQSAEMRTAHFQSVLGIAAGEYGWNRMLLPRFLWAQSPESQG
jgi:hypothetical protein